LNKGKILENFPILLNQFSLEADHWNLSEIPGDPKEAFLWFYEEYAKLKAANSPQTAIPTIGCVQQLQIIGGVANEEQTLRETFGEFMSEDEFRNLRRDSQTFPNAI
jgi:hypothetical protein